MKYAILVLGILLFLNTNAQNHLEDFTLKRSVKQNGLHFNFTVLDADKKGVHNYDPLKHYFWTKAQRLKSTQGASSGNLLHGVFEAFYQNKQLAQKGSFTKGLKHGTWNFWNEDGIFIRTEHWKRGKLSGKQQFFNQKGELIRTEIIRGNRRKRIQADTTIIWKTFDRKSIIVTDSHGNKVEVQNYKNEKLHGYSKKYEDGKLQSKIKYFQGEQIIKEPSENDPEKGATTEEKESGKLKRLWNRWFSREKQKEKAKKKQGTKRNNREHEG